MNDYLMISGPSDRKRIGKCTKCGKFHPKREMTAFYAKEGGQPELHIMCHICFDCLCDFLENLGISMPD